MFHVDSRAAQQCTASCCRGWPPNRPSQPLMYTNMSSRCHIVLYSRSSNLHILLSIAATQTEITIFKLIRIGESPFTMSSERIITNRFDDAWDPPFMHNSQLLFQAVATVTFSIFAIIFVAVSARHSQAPLEDVSHKDLRCSTHMALSSAL